MQYSPAKNQFTYLEMLVFKQLLSINSKHSNELSAQINKAKISSRESSRIGFISYLKVPDDTPSLKTLSTHKVIDCYAEHPDNPTGAGFSLWFRYGRIYALEGYVFIGHWPINELKFKILTTYDSLCSELVNSNHIDTNPNALF